MSTLITKAFRPRNDLKREFMEKTQEEKIQFVKNLQTNQNLNYYWELLTSEEKIDVTLNAEIKRLIDFLPYLTDYEKNIYFERINFNRLEKRDKLNLIDELLNIKNRSRTLENNNYFYQKLKNYLKN